MDLNKTIKALSPAARQALAEKHGGAGDARRQLGLLGLLKPSGELNAAGQRAAKRVGGGR